MINKNDIKLIRSLTIKKYRQRYKKFIVEGEKSVIEAIKYRRKDIEKLYCTQEFLTRNSFFLKGIDDFAELQTQTELERLSNLKNNTTVVALIRIQSNADLTVLNKANLLLYLDGISDPGNLGTIIRTAEWFGVDALICSPDCVDIYNPKVVQSTMGSIFRLPVFSMDFNALSDYTDNKLMNNYVMVMNGTDIYNFDFSFPMTVVIGNESNGVSSEIVSGATRQITIPSSNGFVESLNASVATSIVLSEVFRKNRKDN
jgi:TrmH family RNA methyltransferase